MYQRIISFHQPWKQSSRFLLSTRFQYLVVQQKWLRFGGLYNYGTNYEELGRQTARMLVSCFKGEKPENIAVELPEKLELHTNQEMADALGIDISKLESKE